MSYCSDDEIVISSTVRRIEGLAFFKCKNLKHIKIPSQVYKIGERAFSECESLEEITIPERIEILGTLANFRGIM